MRLTHLLWARRELVERVARDAGDLTLINGVGRHYARLLEEHGIADCAALLTADPDELSISVRRSGRSMSPSRISLWQQHADGRVAPMNYGTTAQRGGRRRSDRVGSAQRSLAVRE